MKNRFEKPKMYTAKALNSNLWFTGYYFEMPETMHLMDTDTEPRILHYLVIYQQVDWNLPNEPKLVEIDMDTIKENT